MRRLRIVTRIFFSGLLVFFFLGFQSPVPGFSQQVRVRILYHQMIESRVHNPPSKEADREAALRGLFEAAGCGGSNLAEQNIKGYKTPNIICTLPGKTEEVVVVGAHFDSAPVGHGLIDNWTGASLLPSLYESLKPLPRRYTYVFVGFAGEEKGLIGSKYYARKLGKEQAAKVQAMINLDSLGLTSTKVEPYSSDQRLLSLLRNTAASLNLALSFVDCSQVGTSDYRYFRELKIPVLSVHSITQQSLEIIHSPWDNERVLDTGGFFGTYRLMAFFLAMLDAQPGSGR